MEYRTVPGNGDRVSALGFGCMRLPTNRWLGVDEKETRRLVHHAVDSGINYFDTAWPYHNGRGEETLGRALEGRRDRVFVSTKLPQWRTRSREQMDDILNRQLRALRTETIDYYFIHALPSMARWKELEEAGCREFLEAARKSGKVRNVGFSFHGAAGEFPRLIDAYPWTMCLVQYNYCDEHNQAGVEGICYAAEKGVAVFVMEPLRGGALAGRLPKEAQRVFAEAPTARTAAEWALRWVWDRPEVTMVLSGMNRMEHLQENLRVAGEALAGTLTEGEKKTVRSAVEVFHRLTRVSCTGCNYCMPCPAGVNIPGCFSHYNDISLLGSKMTARGMYLFQQAVTADGKPSLASQCVGCGMCEEHCPQGIEIRKELKKVERAFEGPFSTPILMSLLRMFLWGRR